MQKRYTQRTAALQATTVDAREVDTKKLKVSGKDITELIGQSSGGVKRIRVAEDTREVITQNDIWDSYVEQGQNGQVIIHTKDKIDFIPPTNEYGEIQAWNNNIIRVEDNKAYIGKDFTDDGFTGEEFYANIKVEKLENGQNMFSNNLHLTTFSGDLTALKNGNNMFNYCYKLESFNSDLSSLIHGEYMFAYCGELTTFDSDLSSLEDGSSMFESCSNLTTCYSNLSSLKNGSYMFDGCSNLSDLDYNLSSLEIGEVMFYRCNFQSFYYDLSSLKNGYRMFECCQNLTNFTSNLNSIEDAIAMFNCCSALTTFTSDLSSLKDGQSMFSNCNNLTTFTSDLSSLITGGGMFQESGLQSFDSDLSSLKDGGAMFMECTNLTTFEIDLSSLINGVRMFWQTPIENFTSILPSLLTGIDMFGHPEAVLTRESLEYIADSINDLAEKGLATKTQEGYWSYSLDWDDENWTNDWFIHPDDRGILSLGIISEDNLDLCQQIANKGWTVLINASQGIVSPTQSTSLDDQVTVTPKPYYAKPVLSDEKRGRYINANGEYFNIIGGNTIIGADLSSFGMFTSLQDAIANMGLTKVEKTSTKKK